MRRLLPRAAEKQKTDVEPAPRFVFAPSAPLLEFVTAPQLDPRVRLRRAHPVKTPPGHPRTRHRNEAVFHSAQRLLSSRPPSRPPAPAPAPSFFSRPRPFAFVAAAVALFATGIFVGLRWRTDQAAASSSNTRNSVPAADTSAHKEPAHTGTLTPSQTPRRPANGSRRDGSSDSGEKSDSTPTTDQTADSATPASALSAAPRLSRAAAETPAVVQTIVTLGAEVTIRGRLTSNSGPPLELEFALRRKDAVLTGVVRYSLPNGTRIVANTVKGDISEARVVELRETSSAWNVSGVSPGILHELRPRRNFVFDLPVQSAAKDEFSGWWASHIQHDNASGYLTLWFSAPW